MLRPTRRTALALTAAALLLPAAAPAAASPAAAEEARPYVVVLRDDVAHPRAVADEHRRRHGAQVSRTYGTALKGYAARLTGRAYADVVRDPRVGYVAPDGVVSTQEVQASAPWGLDRVDQRALPLSTTYAYSATATAVTAYVIDTGVRASHLDLGGRVGPGFSAIDDVHGTGDCNGHGTHVAGTVGGTTHGVAKGVRLVPVRVLGCDGSGTWSGVIAGIDWVAAHHVKPAVANLSLGGGANAAVDDAVRRLVGSGVTTAVAAGNDGRDACRQSPARVAEAVTVGATDRSDKRATYSNHGSCLDLFAPGSGITSAWHTGDTAVNTISGTSMATPHVAGVAALYLQGVPGATPAQVRAAVYDASTKGIVGASRSPDNHLLFAAW